MDHESVAPSAADHPGKIERGPPVRAAIIVEPGRHLGEPVAELLWRDADVDADGEAPLRSPDQVAGTAGHFASSSFVP
jgi:hypothetical protein